MGHRGVEDLAGVFAVARRLVSAGLAILFAFTKASFAVGQAADVVGVRTIATRTVDTIRVDGRLDEMAWRQAPPIGRFVQREPVEGGAPSEDTDVRVLYTDSALYVGVLCRDRASRLCSIRSSIIGTDFSSR